MLILDKITKKNISSEEKQKKGLTVGKQNRRFSWCDGEQQLFPSSADLRLVASYVPLLLLYILVWEGTIMVE